MIKKILEFIEKLVDYRLEREMELVPVKIKTKDGYNPKFVNTNYGIKRDLSQRGSTVRLFEKALKDFGDK